MADVKQEHNKTDDVDAYGMGNSADPKNMQELTQYVSLSEFIFRIFERPIDDRNISSLYLSRNSSF